MNVHKLLLSPIVSTFLLLFLCLYVPAIAGAADTEETSTTSALYIKGLVQEVVPEDRMVTVQPFKGRQLTLQVDEQTLWEGVNSIDQLQKKHSVRIWYRVDNNINTVLKIEKMPDLGC